jgi:uncharacterized protein
VTGREELSRFEVAKLLERPGKRRNVQGEVDLEGVETSTARAARLRYDLEIEAIGAQVVVEGTVTSEWASQCRRCLEPVVGESSLALREVFEAHPTEGETYPIDDTHIDLAAMLEEAVLLGLPLVPLCTSECGGPAPDRFPTGPEPLTEEEPVPDPRWAALDDLTFE